jgi:hypothetical protein
LKKLQHFTGHVQATTMLMAWVEPAGSLGQCKAKIGFSLFIGVYAASKNYFAWGCFSKMESSPSGNWSKDCVDPWALAVEMLESRLELSSSGFPPKAPWQ